MSPTARVPDSYPDEILGSWLAHIRLHNGEGSWKALRMEAGYGRRPEKPMFAATSWDPCFAKMLKLLGTTFDEVIASLTLVPYWLNFDAAPLSSGHSAGDKSVKLTSRRSLDRIGQLTLLGSLVPRWCPICLREDLKEWGEPYWHRSHQLPNVFVCHLHFCLLRTSCERCGAVIATAGRCLMPLPRIECSCGADLRRQIRTVRMSPAYQLLIGLSCAVLRENFGVSGAETRALISSRLVPGGGRIHGEFRLVMSRHFGEITKCGKKLIAHISGDSKTSQGLPTLVFFDRMSKFSARECVAALAAILSDIKNPCPRLDAGRSAESLEQAPPYASNRSSGAAPFAHRASSIQDAAEKILTEDSRPKRITAHMLGREAGLSLTQVQEAIKRTPKLRAFLEYANRTKIRRQIVWAIKNVLESGFPLTHRKILETAGLDGSRGILALMREEIQAVALAVDSYE